MLLLDTSIVVSLYIPEVKSKASTKLVKAEKQTGICYLTEVEFHSAISRLVRMKEITRETGHQVNALFRSHCQNNVFKSFPVEKADYILARDWLDTLDTSLKTLDAIQLAVAYNNQLTLATGDRILAKSAKKLGVNVKTV